MVKINVKRFTTNEAKIQKIVNFLKQPETKNLLMSESNKLYNEVKNSLPENMDRKKISKKKTLKNSLQISQPKYSKAKLKGYSDVERLQITISSKPFQKYFAVVLSGKNSYETSNGRIKKDIKYSNASAKSFAFQDAQKKSENEVYKDFYSLLFKEMNSW